MGFSEKRVVRIRFSQILITPQKIKNPWFEYSAQSKITRSTEHVLRELEKEKRLVYPHLWLGPIKACCVLLLTIGQVGQLRFGGKEVIFQKIIWAKMTPMFKRTKHRT